MAVSGICSVEGCDKRVQSKGYCVTHYGRFWRNGDPHINQRPSVPDKICCIEGCKNKILGNHGWCSKHYQRWQRHGDPLVSLLDRDQTGKPCKKTGCDRASGFLGYCQNHYLQLASAQAKADRAKKHGVINALSDTQAAYIAGFIDADGTISASLISGRIQPLVLVVNCNLGLIRWLLENIGAGCAYETKTAPTRPDQNSANWNKVHRYQISGRKSQALIERCRPFLLVKARQADLIARIPQRGRDFTKEATPTHRSIATEILSELRSLNTRGRKPDHFVMAPVE